MINISENIINLTVTNAQNDFEAEYDMLDYDISDTFDSATVIKFIPAVIVYSLTFIIGFIGKDNWLDQSIGYQ